MALTFDVTDETHAAIPVPHSSRLLRKAFGRSALRQYSALPRSQRRAFTHVRKHHKTIATIGAEGNVAIGVHRPTLKEWFQIAGLVSVGDALTAFRMIFARGKARVRVFRAVRTPTHAAFVAQTKQTCNGQAVCVVFTSESTPFAMRVTPESMRIKPVVTQ
jgi:hypothetical protein